MFVTFCQTKREKKTSEATSLIVQNCVCENQKCFMKLRIVTDTQHRQQLNARK